MNKTTKDLFWMFLIAGILTLGGCGILNKSGCGCPPVPTAGKMKH